MFQPLLYTAPDAPRYIKLDSQGNPLADSSTDHVILRDTATQLEWLVPYASAEKLSHADAMATCAALEAGGHNDWRLPTRFELESTLDLSRYNPAVDPALLPGTSTEWHWSSSPAASAPGYAWLVFFGDGGVHLYGRGYVAWVRAVRSVPASQ